MIRSRSAALGLLVMAFILGGMTGSAATALWSDHGPPKKDKGKFDYAKDVGDSLQLKQSTQTGITEILEKHGPAFDSIWSSVRTRAEAEMRAVRSEIRTYLNTEEPAKLAPFDSLMSRWDARRDSLRREKNGKHRRR